MNIYSFSGRLTEVYSWEKQIQWILSFIFSRNNTVSASFVRIFAHLYNYKEKCRKICMLILMSFASEQWVRSGWGKIANFISLSIFFWWGPFLTSFLNLLQYCFFSFFFNFGFLSPRHVSSWLPRDWTCTLWTGRHTLNYWTSEEVPGSLTLKIYTSL